MVVLALVVLLPFGAVAQTSSINATWKPVRNSES